VLQLLRQRTTAGPLGRAGRVAAASSFVPNRKAGTFARGNHHFFCGNYSADGRVYMSACQGTLAQT
jgi:hypothetical protein